MNHFPFVLFCIWKIMAASTSPLISNLGDVFRSGEVTVTIANQSLYDFNIPYPQSFSNNSVALALSMPSYKQVFDTTNKIHFMLLEDTPSSSTSTHAVFRVQLGLYALTSVAKVKYFSCLSSALSQNFNIMTKQLFPGTLQPNPVFPYYYVHKIDVPLNTVNRYQCPLWISGVEGWKPSSESKFYLSALFVDSKYGHYNDSEFTRITDDNKIIISNDGTNTMHIRRVRVTLFFINQAFVTLSGAEKLPYYKRFSTSAAFPFYLGSLNSWFEAVNTICGVRFIYLTNNFYGYSTNYEGNGVSFEWADGAGNTASIYCIVAGPKMCPIEYPYYDRSTDLCHDSCSGQNTNDYLCTPAYTCPLYCKYCSSNIVCKVCYQTYYLRSDDLCYSTCLSGFYPQSSNLTCSSCPLGCDTCTSLVSCQACSPSFYLRSDNLCYSTCLEGYLTDNSTQTCRKCPAGCAVCTSPSVCSLCYPSSDSVCNSFQEQSSVESSSSNFLLVCIIAGCSLCLIVATVAILVCLRRDLGKALHSAVVNDSLVQIGRIGEKKGALSHLS